MLSLADIIAPIILVCFGGGGILYTILNWHRDQAAAQITQHSKILEDMAVLYELMKGERDDLHREVLTIRQENEVMRGERDALRKELGALRKEVAHLRSILDKAGLADEYEKRHHHDSR